ncbi:MAG TPA: hypothetical protein VKE96_12460 [Vicinamibacterales bacterium]|nr:hypothetical protein [Vicinamibacterales bacterium]
MASAGTYAPDPDLHVVDSNGLPVAGGLVWTYIAGTLTPVATYTDVALSIPNSNPIVAGSDGRFVAFLAPGNSYKFVYESAATPPTHGAVLATRDNIGAIPISSPSTDVSGTAGELLTQGQCVYLSSGLGGKVSGQWYLADADFDYASSTASLVGIVVNTALAGTQCLVRLGGQIAIPGLTLTPGAAYYVSQTAGAITATVPPVAPPAYTRYLGQALDVSTLAVTVPINTATSNDTFTGDLTITKSTPRITVIDTSQGVDLKTFRLGFNSQLFQLSAVNDALSVATLVFAINRNGDVFEKGRGVAMGHWSSVPYSAANFTAVGGGTWTVDAGDVLFYDYALVGKTMWLNFNIMLSTLSGTVNELRIAYPGGYSSAGKPTYTPIYTNAGSAAAPIGGWGFCIGVTQASYLALRNDINNTVAWPTPMTNNLYLFGTCMVELA